MVGVKIIGLMMQGWIGGVVNEYEIVIGEFIKNCDFQIFVDWLCMLLQVWLGDKVGFFDVLMLVLWFLGDLIYFNMLVLGVVWQCGLILLIEVVILCVIELNGVKVVENQWVFQIGCWVMLDLQVVGCIVVGLNVIMLLFDLVEYCVSCLVEYQDQVLVDCFCVLVVLVLWDLCDSVVCGFYKLLVYKDEYEVVCLYLIIVGQIVEEFESGVWLSFYLVLLILFGCDLDGWFLKCEFGVWVLLVFCVLVWMKWLCGLVFDFFGWMFECCVECVVIV